MRVGWLDLRAGVSGDMLLGALVDAGVPLAVLQEAVDAIGVEPIALRTGSALRHGLGATQVHVETAIKTHHRSLADITGLLDAAELPAAVLDRAGAVFERLAHAEAHVHRQPVETVHFHEVGALDAVADVVGVVAGFHYLALDHVAASAVALGSGSTRATHGVIPVPSPAVLQLLQGAPVVAGSVEHESCTPTGAALVAELVDEWSALPAMRLGRTGYGAGGRDPAEYPNLVRLVLGETAGAHDRSTAYVVEANVDDLDPRLWPDVLHRLLDLGAADAWLTPVLMKKGRAAHTLGVLTDRAHLNAVRTCVLSETSTIGLRVSEVEKTALDRITSTVEVHGMRVATKTALLDGRVVNVSVEHDDVVAVAAATGVTAKAVLRAAEAAAHDAAAGSS